MRARAAEVKPLHRGPITRPTEQRTHCENLIERQLAVKRMPTGEPDVDDPSLVDRIQ